MLNNPSYDIKLYIFIVSLLLVQKQGLSSVLEELLSLATFHWLDITWDFRHKT